MARETRKTNLRRERTIPVSVEGCIFCKKDSGPDYKDAEALIPFLTDRGKIIGRGRSGLCARHQRRLAKAVKRARHLALLPFVQRI